MKWVCEIPEVWAVKMLENQVQAYWISSLTQSWHKGYPDNSSMPWSHIVDLVRRLRIHTDKEIWVDIDMGFAEPDIAAIMCRELELSGATHAVIEDKVFPKVNSLLKGVVLQIPERQCQIIGKIADHTDSIEVVARTEYLYTHRNPEQTIGICRKYVDAGAAQVVVHWNTDDPELLKETLPEVRKIAPVGIIPTTFLPALSDGDFDELADFAILGNIISSHLHASLEGKTIGHLMKSPSPFAPLLDQSQSLKPAPATSMVVLGAKPTEHGIHLLAQQEVVERFVRFAEENGVRQAYFVVDENTDLEWEDDTFARAIRINDSLGEIHSLSVGLEQVYTDRVAVVYADVLSPALQSYSWYDSFAVFDQLDTFLGLTLLETVQAAQVLSEMKPDASLIELVSKLSVDVLRLQI